MKKLSKLNGAKALSKNEQKSINGGQKICPESCYIGNMSICPGCPMFEMI